MTAKVIIPVYGFTGLLPAIMKFYKDNLEEALVFVVNDDPKMSLSGFSDENAIISNNMIRGDLRHTFHHYTEYTETTDIVITNEHDVMPKLDALYAGLTVFEQMRREMKLASVSCMYFWNDVLCYPSHPNWYKDEKIDIGEKFGRAAILGAQGVPFGFTIWDSKALSLIDNTSLPKIWKLDSAFGVLLNGHGYNHIRLIDYNVEHYNKGVNSWKM